MSDTPQPIRQITAIVNAINNAWLKDQSEELARYFHEEIVIVAPGFMQRSEGRAACIQSYRDFNRQARIHSFSSTECTVDQWDSTAVATSEFTIAYEMNGQRYDEKGRDLIVFARANDSWLAVWRTILNI